MLFYSRNKGLNCGWRGRHYMPGPTAAGSIHEAEVERRVNAAGVGSVLVPVQRRRVVWRRHAHPLLEIAPEGEHRFRQPGLGGLGKPPHGLLEFLPLMVIIAQPLHSVYVPLSCRLL